MKDFLALAEARRSVRRFHADPLEFDDVLYVLRCALAAPSAGDRQMWEFIIITENEKIIELAETCPEQRWMRDAPLIIAVLADVEEGESYFHDHARNWCMQSCAAATENMLLAVEDRGLGACWVTSYDQGQMREVLGVPGKYDVAALVAIGKPDQVPGEKQTRAMDQIMHFNSYGAKITDFQDILRNYNQRVEKAKVHAKKKADIASLRARRSSKTVKKRFVDFFRRFKK